MLINSSADASTVDAREERGTDREWVTPMMLICHGKTLPQHNAADIIDGKCPMIGESSAITESWELALHTSMDRVSECVTGTVLKAITHGA